MSFGSNSSRTDFDPGLTADLRSVFQEGKKLYDQPYQPYPYARVAPLSPFELEGQGRAIDAARAGLGQGQVADATSTARGLSGYNMSDVDSFMNPYTQQVIDPVLRDIEQSRAMQQQANASRALAAGAFGGDRQGLVDAETNRLAMQQAGDISGRLRQQGFRDAQDASLSSAGVRGRAANLLAGLGEQQRGMTYDDARMLSGVGREQRGFGQSLLDDVYGRFAERRDYPIRMLQVLGSAAGLLPDPRQQTSKRFDFNIGGSDDPWFIP